MLEAEVQRRFVDLISDKKPISDAANNPIRIYKELVHYRFEEVIRNAMPDFCALLEEARLEALIFDFIQSKPISPFVWQVPLLFRAYLIENNCVNDIAYADDLMWFESVEVELLMGAYDKPSQEKFEWEDNFSLSDSMRMKVLHYDVNQENFEYVDAHPLIMYYHFQEHAVFYQEITPFMYQFLTLLQEHTPLESLQRICRAFEIEAEDEVKELLQEALESFVQLHIITKD